MTFRTFCAISRMVPTFLECRLDARKQNSAFLARSWSGWGMKLTNLLEQM